MQEPVAPQDSVVSVCRALRVWRHGQPIAIQHAATTTIYYLRQITRGCTTPQVYAALAEKIEKLRE